MGTSRYNSVVNPRGAVWGTDNLYVADAVSRFDLDICSPPERVSLGLGSQSHGDDYGLRVQYRGIHAGRPGKWRDDENGSAGSALTCRMYEALCLRG